MSRSWIAYLLVGAVLSSVGIGQAFGNEAPPVLLGKKAPVFEGKDLDGNPVTLASLRKENEVLLVNFWGLRCGACVEEIPHLNAIYAKFRDSGLKILGVNVDGLPGPKVKVQMEASAIKIDYPWIPDREFKVIDAFQMAGAPLNVIIDSSGKVVYYREGFEQGEQAQLEAEIAKVLQSQVAK